MSSTGHPSIAARVVTTSRVVPAVGETIARENPATAFSNRLFPTFGRPVKTTFQPPSNRRPMFDRSINTRAGGLALPSVARRCKVSISRSSAPSNWSSRIDATRSVSALARSLSAWLWIEAGTPRTVPTRTPRLFSSDRIAAIAAVPPWPWISTAGGDPSSTSATTSSPPANRPNLGRAGTLWSSRDPRIGRKSAEAIESASRPETRTTPTAPRPSPVRISARVASSSSRSHIIKLLGGRAEGHHRQSSQDKIRHDPRFRPFLLHEASKQRGPAAGPDSPSILALPSDQLSECPDGAPERPRFHRRFRVVSPGRERVPFHQGRCVEAGPCWNAWRERPRPGQLRSRPLPTCPRRRSARSSGPSHTRPPGPAPANGPGRAPRGRSAPDRHRRARAREHASAAVRPPPNGTTAHRPRPVPPTTVPASRRRAD